MPQFDYFVILAEMRTGSNFLEDNLNDLDDVTCYGEAFNPHFIGYPKRNSMLGLTQEERDSDPMRLLTQIKWTPGVLGGFRYFHDHDPRVLDTFLDDASCAKILLTRNPLDSYVSWKIAQSTNQWKLTNLQRQKKAKARFDPDEFVAQVSAIQDFQIEVLNRLQVSGQTAFYVTYDDLQSLDVLNGMAKWLGVEARLNHISTRLKRQNPDPPSEKVTNPSEMAAALADLDPFNVSRTPHFEPRRGAAVPTYVAAKNAPLLYLPIKGGPTDHIEAWLASLDDVAVRDLHRNMTQKELRQWMRSHKNHQKFTILPHPLDRAYATFCTKILSNRPGGFPKIRQALRKSFDLRIPDNMPNPNYSVLDHRQAFLVFLKFVKANLAGQTALRVDPTWCTQAQVLQGFADFALPDQIIRATDATARLSDLASHIGVPPKPVPPPAAPEAPYDLSDIYDDALEVQIADVYRRDYLMFGFEPWQPS